MSADADMNGGKMAVKKQTMMEQYKSIKDRYNDSILFFRLGDFYEMFYDDAKLASRVLGLTLTGKNCGEEERAPMCGVPFHSADGYIGKLVSAGYRVVICEQTEDPATAKGLVNRDVIRIVTPGTLIEASLLDENTNNYLASLAFGSGEAAICFADVSTGEIDAVVISGEHVFERIAAELGTFRPHELLADGDCETGKLAEIRSLICDRFGGVIAPFDPAGFDIGAGRAMIERQFGKTPEELGVMSDVLISSLGALLRYIGQTQKVDAGYIKSLNLRSEGQYLEMDLSTRRSLELCETMRAKEKKGTLLWVLDRTCTAMGGRLLRKWIELPLRNVSEIKARQDAVAEFAANFELREEFGELLSSVLDLERLQTRVAYGSANARDLRAMAVTLSTIPRIKALFEINAVGKELHKALDGIDDCADITELIFSAISDEPPVTVREGGMIRRGYNADVDELDELLNNAGGVMSQIEARERERTGIKNLRVGYNRVFGYYIEVTNSFLDLVPGDFIRKQTLTGGERYITQELKELETKVLTASDRITALEYSIFCGIRDTVAKAQERIRRCADALAVLDVYRSLGVTAAEHDYCRPEVDYGDVIRIKAGRHPVVERTVTDGAFVPNDTYLDCGTNRLMLITGPNMAGKSTYMRQVALITLMAQIGSFVPASEARISVCDKLFTRVGASDDLASGQSTFMLEMTEVAYILSNATARSLILYDEIGRGTSTFDGMSIARAVAEYTAGKKLGAKTMFATHYHELTEMENEIPGVVNYSIAAKKKDDELIFLRRIMRGAADDSYGIEVAKLAGVPAEIVRRAKKVLAALEQHSAEISAAAATQSSPAMADADEIDFDEIRRTDVRDKILATDIDSLSPREALELLYELKKLAE